MSIVEKINELKSLRTQLALNLKDKGVTTTSSEGFADLVPKVLEADKKGTQDMIEAFVYKKGVTSKIANSLSYPNGIGPYVFAGCTNLSDFDFTGKGFAVKSTDISLPGAYSSLKKINEGAFMSTNIDADVLNRLCYGYDAKLSSRVFEECTIHCIDDTLRIAEYEQKGFIIPENLFKNAKFIRHDSSTSIKYLTIGGSHINENGTIMICNQAFLNTSITNNISIYNGKCNMLWIGEEAFAKNSVNSMYVNIMSDISMLYVYKDAFKNCAGVNLSNITNAYYIYSGAFNKCSNVIINLSNPIISNYEFSGIIESRAFMNAKILGRIGNFFRTIVQQSTNIPSGAFYGAKIVEPEVFSAFSKCKAIGEAAFKSTIFANQRPAMKFQNPSVIIEKEAFMNANIFNFTVDISNGHGCIYEVSEKAFYGCNSMSYVNFVKTYDIYNSYIETTNTIHSNAFGSCPNLQLIELSPYTSGANFYNNAFYRPVKAMSVTATSCSIFLYGPMGYFTDGLLNRSVMFTPPFLENTTVFDDNTTVYVPLAFYALYKSATNFGLVNLKPMTSMQNKASVVKHNGSSSTGYIIFSSPTLNGWVNRSNEMNINEYSYYLTNNPYGSKTSNVVNIQLSDQGNTEIIELAQAMTPQAYANGQWCILEKKIK